MKICIIVPYFGKFPNYFDLFLKSCEKNEDINWLIITDDKQNYNYPKNVKVLYEDFDEFKKFIQKKFDFNISLSSPYKLCDYKPAYGYIFNDHLFGYDFWGYCDVDLIFGNIRKFITNEVLKRYDKIGHMGHLSIYKNNDLINRMFMSSINGKQVYKEVFSNETIFVFDEWNENSINQILINNKKKVYCNNLFADVYPFDEYFHTIYYDPTTMKWVNNRRNIYSKWDKGNVYCFDVMTNKCVKECIYIHLQKRKLKKIGLNESNESFVIFPNIIAGERKNTKFFIRLICVIKLIFNFTRLKFELKKFKYWLAVKTYHLRHGRNIKSNSKLQNLGTKK